MDLLNCFEERHWGPDPSNFRPERFIDTEDYTWPRDAFLGFSAGPRACLGQKFAQIEAVAIITHIVRKYEVLLKEDVNGTAPKNETREQKRDRVTRAKTVSRAQHRLHEADTFAAGHYADAGAYLCSL